MVSSDVSQPGVPPSARAGHVATLQTLHRGLRLFETIVQEGPASAKVLARRCGLNLSTCYHLLRTLESEQYIVRGGHGTFVAGPRAAALGRHVLLAERTSPALVAILWQLGRTTRETVYLTAWSRGILAISDWIPRVGNEQNMPLGAGYAEHMHARASAKAVLAHLTSAERSALLSAQPLQPLTGRTVTSLPAFERELDQVRNRGFALDLEEFAIGRSCVAAPILLADGTPIGAIALAAPSERFQQRYASYVEAVQYAADRATRECREHAEEQWGA